MVVMSRRFKKQIRTNAGNIDSIQGNGRNVFRRRKSVPKPAKNIGTKIFQVRSYAAPKVISSEGEDLSLSRVGIYNCIEMVVDNELFEDFTTGWESLANSFTLPNRITDEQGVVKKNYVPSVDGEDYDQWDSVTAYVSGNVVEVITEYTDFEAESAGLPALRKVSNIYRSKTSNTNKPPASNTDDWLNLTVEVLNISEAYTMRNAPVRYPKLAKYDTILATSNTDNTGVDRWSGTDTIGNTRLFITTGEADPTSIPVASIIPLHPSAFQVETVDGELNYETQIDANWSSGGVTGNQISWVGIEVTVSATWLYGVWTLTPYWMLAMGNGVEANTGVINVKVDETTIDFNGSGELEQIP